MAVFTSVSAEQIQKLLLNYNLGTFLNLQGIQGGIENTNYFLTTSTNTYVLTIFERLNFAQLPFYLELMKYLAQKNICVPLPISNKQNQILFEINNKPATIVTKLSGKSELNPKQNHIKSIASQLAKMHIASQDFPLQQKNLRSIEWWNQVLPEISPFLSIEQKNLLNSELKIQNLFFASKDYSLLPQGICHCDLFRDNALFIKQELSGIFDFYFAGIDKFLFDICVVINDWCIDYDKVTLSKTLSYDFLNSYIDIRPLTAIEKKSINLMLRASALRFWLSRLWDYYLPRNSDLLVAHNPKHFEKLLQYHIENQFSL